MTGGICNKWPYCEGCEYIADVSDTNECSGECDNCMYFCDPCMGSPDPTCGNKDCEWYGYSCYDCNGDAQ